MSKIVFDVNTDEVIKLTNKLERMRKNAFPLAVRQTLTNAAFETKENVPLEAQKKFITRNKTFFRMMTLVNKVEEKKDINKMESQAGINTKRFPKLAERLAVQETGGTLKRETKPTTFARVGKSIKGRVPRRFQYRNTPISSGSSKTGFIKVDKGNQSTIFRATKKGLIPLYVHKKGDTVKAEKNLFVRSAATMPTQHLPMNFVRISNNLIKKIK
jgi:hypothetical protein